MKFALHSGWVTSRNDGDHHYVPAYRLIQLYELRPGEYIIWPQPDKARGMKREQYRHLYPRSDGKYGRPVSLSATIES